MKFNKYKLGDLCDLKIGRTPPRKEHEWFSKDRNDYKWISIKDMGSVNKYISDSSEYLTEKAVEKFNIPIVNPNTILVSFKLTVGKTAISTIKMTTNEAIAQLPIKNDKLVDNEYLYYFLSNYPYDSLGSTSSIATAVNSTILKDIEVELPSLIIQNQISKVLREIDDKIELNNKINKNLLNQGEILFDKIYILGKPTTLNSLLDIIESGSRPKGGAENQGIPSIGAEKIECFGVYDFSNEKYVSNDFYQNLKRGKVLSSDVLLYKDGAYTGKVSMSLDDFPYKECAINEHVFIIRTRNNFAQFFLYFLLSKNENKQQIITMASSKAAQPGLNSQELLNTNILLPDNEVIVEFEKTISPLMHKIAANAKENRKLVSLRNKLLPKLMSGEIDVSKIDI